MTSARWLVAGTTTAARSGRDLTAIAVAVAGSGFTHIAVADTDPRTLDPARQALKLGVPGLVVFVAPVSSWPLGRPPRVEDAYPSTDVLHTIEQVLHTVGRAQADLVLAHKWDPGWNDPDARPLDDLLEAGLASEVGVSCPDSHPGAATATSADVVCVSWNVHDQGVLTHADAYQRAGTGILGRAPFDHGILTSTWPDRERSPHDWRMRWLGTSTEEANRRSDLFNATARAHELEPAEAALRFTIRDDWPRGLLVGVSDPLQVAAIATWAGGGPLPPETRDDLARHSWPARYGGGT